MKIYAAPLVEGHLPPQVGTVDHLEGVNFIKLKRANTFDGQAHWIPTEWVTRVEGNAIYLNQTQTEFHRNKLYKTPVSLTGL
ncbi:DUF2171 domain-containing protein [bacterium]|nr:DUF2171 domain-containing protein [bacterium]